MGFNSRARRRRRCSRLGGGAVFANVLLALWGRRLRRMGRRRGRSPQRAFTGRWGVCQCSVSTTRGSRGGVVVSVADPVRPGVQRHGSAAASFRAETDANGYGLGATLAGKTDAKAKAVKAAKAVKKGSLKKKVIKKRYSVTFHRYVA